MHVIDWLSYKLDDEYMDASLDETMNVNIKKLHALVTKIHHLYFQFACAQIKSSSDDKQE